MNLPIREKALVIASIEVKLENDIKSQKEAERNAKKSRRSRM